MATNPYRALEPGDDVEFGKGLKGKLLKSYTTWTFFGETYSEVSVEGLRAPVLVATRELYRPPCPTCERPYFHPGGYVG